MVSLEEAADISITQFGAHLDYVRRCAEKIAPGEGWKLLDHWVQEAANYLRSEGSEITNHSLAHVVIRGCAIWAIQNSPQDDSYLPTESRPNGTDSYNSSLPSSQRPLASYS